MGLAVVIVDLLGVQTLDDVAVRIGHAWSRLPAGALAKAAAKVLPFVAGVDVAGGVVNVAMRPSRASDARALEAVLDVPTVQRQALGLGDPPGRYATFDGDRLGGEGPAPLIAASVRSSW